MKNIVIALNPSKDTEGFILDKVLLEIKSIFKKSDITVINSFDMSKIKIDEKLDLIIVLGGDGTILGVARDINGITEAPILGINIGNLGFLASIEIQDLKNALIKIANNQYKIEKRILLQCEILLGEVNESNRALNDIVVARGTLSRMARFKLYIDNRLYCDFKGDGIIIATPTGSTAYSFSAGGPFVYPDVDVITITPICPQSKGMQTIVLNSNSVIRIEAENNKDEIYLTIDGQKSIKNEENSIIEIKRAENRAKILLLDDYDYFKVLRKKILNK